MEYAEVLEQARRKIGPNCHVCPVCDGRACGNLMPGPGSKAPGNGAYDNYSAWRRIRVNMDTIVSGSETDPSVSLFGRTLSFPLLTAPIGSIQRQFNPQDDVSEFNDSCMAACHSRGILHAYGSGLEQRVWDRAVESSAKYGNTGIPVFNPDPDEKLRRLMDFSRSKEEPAAMCMVVDSAGLPHYRNMMQGSGGFRGVKELRVWKEYARGPLIIKGIMTVKGAYKAMEAGADAIIVSNHGGRVCSDAMATAEVLPEIAEAVNGRMKVLVDGGIRSGMDVFKALALGADACLICRPVLISWYGGGQEGIECYLDKIRSELEDTMRMCGARTVAEITRDMVRLPYGGCR